MKRQLLVYSVVGLVAIGAALAAVPFLASLSLNDRARSKLTPIDVSELGIGGFKALQTEAAHYYVMRLSSDDFSVLWVPSKGGVVQLPDVHWWRPRSPCHDFGPDIEAGVLAVHARFRCRDVDSSIRPQEAWLWDMRGRYAGPKQIPMDDMPKARFELAGSQILIRPAR